MKSYKLSPILKWIGGKEQELKHIHYNMPEKIKNYYEPFIGGGAVYFSVDAKEMFINDKSHELISFYNTIASQDKKFFKVMDEIMKNWKILEEIVQNNRAIFIDSYKCYSSSKYDENKIKDTIQGFVLNQATEFRRMFSACIDVNIENFVLEIRKNILHKINRMKTLELVRGKLEDSNILDNMESALKSAFYKHMRHLYNNIKKYDINDSIATAIFYFIRNYAYGGMFRYNNSGVFNVPYGGVGYNRRSISKKVKYLKSRELVKHLLKTEIDNLDFEDFLKKNQPKKDDFIFLDPPYDSEFNTYTQNEFTREDQIRLASYLVNKCKANWMMIIKYTDFIYDLYDKPNININAFDKKYCVSIKNRNNKEVKHLLITNYIGTEVTK